MDSGKKRRSGRPHERLISESQAFVIKLAAGVVVFRPKGSEASWVPEGWACACTHGTERDIHAYEVSMLCASRRMRDREITLGRVHHRVTCHRVGLDGTCRLRNMLHEAMHMTIGPNSPSTRVRTPPGTSQRCGSGARAGVFVCPAAVPCLLR